MRQNALLRSERGTAFLSCIMQMEPCSPSAAGVAVVSLRNEGCSGLRGAEGGRRGCLLFSPQRKSNLSEMCKAVFNCFLPRLYIAIWLFIGCLCSDFYCNLLLYMRPSVC